MTNIPLACEDLAYGIFQLGIFRKECDSPEGKGFRLHLHEENPEAPLSPFKLEFERADNDFVHKIAHEFCRMMHHLNYRPAFVAGVPTGGDIFAVTLVEVRLERRIPIMRLAKNPDGGMVVVEPRGLRSGEVLLIEDALTTGRSCLAARAAIRDAGCEVRHVFAIANREQHGARTLQGEGITVNFLIPLTGLLDYGLKHKRLSEEEAERYRKHIDPF